MAGADSETGIRPLHWGLVLLAVLALKQGYSLAGAEQLQWLLAPLAEMLNAFGGLSFRPQPGGDWLDVGRRVVLVKACAGGNFLLTAWLAYLWRWRRVDSVLRTVASAAGAAWITALAANVLRILLAVNVQDALARLGGLDPSETHRLVGIAVYFFCMWGVLYRRGRIHAALVVAAGLYLGINLALPALRGLLLGLPAPNGGHLLWTAGVPIAAIALSLLLRRAGAVASGLERPSAIPRASEGAARSRGRRVRPVVTRGSNVVAPL